jgi:hypothetical protein
MLNDSGRFVGYELDSDQVKRASSATNNQDPTCLDRTARRKAGTLRGAEPVGDVTPETP